MIISSLPTNYAIKGRITSILVKQHNWLEKGPLEDVFPIENRDMPIAMLVYQKVAMYFFGFHFAYTKAHRHHKKKCMGVPTRNLQSCNSTLSMIFGIAALKKKHTK